MFFRALRDSVVQGIVIALIAIIVAGCVFYPLVEGWSLVDSFYFCIASLTTVGYGDIAPETTAGKLFTSFYIVSGVAIFAAAGTTIVQRSRLWARLEERSHPEDATR